ncbi:MULTISPECIES: YeaC family protein [Moraxella]|uniref:YeaC family protein n=1 Tax=Moraxella nasicaprae TaxID=2904122 RepID=A0ABY6F3Z8_9GAMM|nr:MULTISPECIES: YeaC family protein [Moraxella]MDO4894469.1 YeaC family protein [Moraxella sp.]UXZ04712.1 YeaC family protein [Moraxella nasicaprae]
MNKQDILANLTPEIVDKFRTAIEIGKWENGERLTDAQRATCMQAVMVWEYEYLPITERTGYIHKPVKDDGTVVGEECDVEHDHHYPNEQPVKFKH